MSKYQPKIIINDPPKNVPEDITSKFFMVIKSGDINNIREFVMLNKNKYNLIETRKKDSSQKTPFHVVLELDDAVADNNQKLRIMQFLSQMGAPMDLPDINDVWPIHLAAAGQSDKIVNFLINKHVALNRQDSSNNTPLHYAIFGKQVPCPKKISVGPLAPLQKIDKLPLNKSLENANITLMKMLSGNKEFGGEIFSNNVIHMINTIMRIPEMYAESDLERNLQAEIITTFADIAMVPTYTGGLTEQQNKLESLINKTYSQISQDILRGLTSQLQIGPNKGGWGPTVNARAPTDMERIMEKDRDSLRKELENDYLDRKNSVTSIKDINTVNSELTILPKLEETLDSYLINLIFCSDCKDAGIYTEEVGLTKMLYLLIINDFHNSKIPDLVADKLLENFRLISEQQHKDFLKLNTPISQADDYIYKKNNNTLFLNIVEVTKNNTDFDKLLSLLIKLNSIYINEDDCIQNELTSMFTNSNIKTDSPYDLYSDDSPLTESLNNLLELLPESRSLRRIIMSSQDPQYRNLETSWFAMLSKLIRDEQPNLNATMGNDAVNAADKNNVFFKATAANIYEYNIPETPLPGKNANSKRSYTYYELFRIMFYLETYLEKKQIDVKTYPKIFSSKINEWDQYIDTLALKIRHNQKYTIGSGYPEFIFLYKVLIRLTQFNLKEIIKNCVNQIIKNAVVDINPYPSIDENNAINEIKKYVFSDAYAYYLLLPSTPSLDINEIITTVSPQPLDAWIPTHSLIEWFDKFKKRIPASLINSIHNAFISDYSDPFKINPNEIRKFIQKNVSQQSNDDIQKIIKNIRKPIRQYFGTFKERKDKKKPPTTLEIEPIINTKNYLKIIKKFEIKNTYNENLTALKSNPKNISDLFFLTETYGYFFAAIEHLVAGLTNRVSTLNKIITDIILYTENNKYYIPQIFLPALVEQIIKVIKYLITIHNYLTDFAKQINNFYPLIDKTVNENVEILKIDKTQEITKYLNAIYSDMEKIITYHNEVIDFLNSHSSYQLINSRKGANNEYTTSDLFNMNLVPLPKEKFPGIFTGAPNPESLFNILRMYRIPEITYFGSTDTNLFDVFTTTTKSTIFDNYRDIIEYKRTSIKLSNFPKSGDNSQLNITAIDKNDVPEYTVHPITNAIAGPWLQKGSFADAFIAYNSADYTFNWADGMPPSIKSYLDRHFLMLKQKIIEDIIRYIIDNYYKTVKRNEDLVNLYNDLKSLGTETDDKLSDVKVYIVIGKLVDALLNKIFEYTVKQSISTWIRGFVVSNPSYSNLVNITKQTITIIRQKDYLKLSLPNINKDAIEDLLSVDPKKKYIDFQLSQIEQNPREVKYITKPNQTEFVNYLYDINYFPINTESNKKCYYVNPKIIPKLITGETINAKNSDGNTPLHLAVDLNYPELVELLISKGANPRGFTNIHGKTPQDIGLSNAEIQLNYIVAPTVIETINYFVEPFNDLLMSRLLEDKYKNNIIKYVTFGIPIKLVIYNHMFHLYLENYRYGFSIEIKDKIIKLLKKHHGIDNQIYPLDLFIINDQNELKRIIEPENEKNRANKTISVANQKKINFYDERLKELEIQKNGVEKEMAQTSDPEQIDLLRRVQVIVADTITKTTNKIRDLKPKEDLVYDPALMSVYQSAVNSLKNKIGDRDLPIIQFYNDAFKLLGNTNELYLNIWNNYLHKPLFSAPSMIFPLLNDIVVKIIQTSKKNEINAEIKDELTTIVSFYDIVSKYIESRKTYPDNTEDNSILKEDFNQLVYLINLILTPAIYNILLNQIYSAIKEMDGTESIVTDQKNVFDSITNTKFNGETLEKFLKNKLPGKVIKYYTSMYETDEDPDRKTTNASEIFLPIIQIVKSNKLVMISDDSLLVQNLTDYLIPFIENTYQNFVHHIRLSVYGYEKYLLNVYQLIRILQSIV